ncbi:hypothetical protein GC170_22315 [bacterium]|nr:hypothetical protein [bacterium]
MTDDFPDPEDDYDRSRLAEIRSRGWAVIAIDESDHSPAYVFSAGFHHSFDHVLLICKGVPFCVEDEYGLPSPFDSRIPEIHRFPKQISKIPN